MVATLTNLTRAQRMVYEYVRDNSPVTQTEVIRAFEQDYVNENSARQSIGMILKVLFLRELIVRVEPPKSQPLINVWKVVPFGRKK